MSDRFVTVASYTWMPEAQMAKNLLESEGIPAFLAGEMTANVLNGVAGDAHLQVHEENAQRAVRLLATVSAKASLDPDWESQAESGLWTCSLCGMAIALSESICPACQTPNASFTTDRRDTWASPSNKSRERAGVKTNDQVQAEAPRPVFTSTAEDAEPAIPKAGTGCAVLLFVPLLWPLWLLCC